MNPVLLQELKKVIAFDKLPDEHLQWILDHTEYIEFNDGDVIIKKDEPVDIMWILLQGRVDFYMDVNGTQVFYHSFQNEESTGGIGGLLPYSRMKNSIGFAYAFGKVRGLTLHKKHFLELEQLNPELIQRLIGYMTERARTFATTKLQHEKVSALGNLAAGIAHELNNPAAAIDRISSELSKRLIRNFALTEQLLTYNIHSGHILNLKSKVEQSNSKTKQKISALQSMELEDELSQWLDECGITGMPDVVETFTTAGISGKDLQEVQTQVSAEAFSHLLLWIENLLSSQRLLKDLEEASTRISHLVGAIKSHVHMDRTNELQPTDIHNDIDNTLTLLGYKLREKNIVVKKSYCSDLPAVPAYVGELNQVWTNIIDNAIYAVSQEGEITIETTCDAKNVNVRIIDNGAGIPEKILSRIFDPFFTTKKVGEGTGIGLDLVNRIIKRHNGTITVQSKPGRTEFKICVPLTAGKGSPS